MTRKHTSLSLNYYLLLGMVTKQATILKLLGKRYIMWQQLYTTKMEAQMENNSTMDTATEDVFYAIYTEAK
jgi:hypothetical protein